LLVRRGRDADPFGDGQIDLSLRPPCESRRCGGLERSGSKGQEGSRARAGSARPAAIPPGERAGTVIDKLLPLLADSIAAGALAAIPPGERAGTVIDKLLPLLADSGSGVRITAVQALATIPPGERAGIVIDKLLPLLADSDRDVRSAAAQALAAIPPGERAGTVIDKLLPLLADSDSGVRSFALAAVRQIGPGGVSTALVAMKLIHNDGPSAIGPLRAAAHIATGADARKEQTETLLAWLGRPATPPLAAIANDPAGAHKVLELLLRHWSALSTVTSLRKEAEETVMSVIYAACRTPTDATTWSDFLNALNAWLVDLPMNGPVHPCWAPAEKRTVEKLLVSFKEQHSTYETALADHLGHEAIAPLTKWISWSLAGWTLLWAGFLLAFPWSPTVQAIFFWNPRVREMLSLWFVPLLLLVFPFLRRRLLDPFHDDLIGTAQPRTFSRLGFFGQARARLDGGMPAAIDTMLVGLRGTVVVRGEAGLGKTSALRWLALTARCPVAFLHARECTEGVDVAIARMIHQIQEVGFIRSMVHTRAMMVIIDGLNEVSADTREKVGAFARDMSRGNVLIGTQPIEWLPPKGAQIVDLMPLDRPEALRFLLTRPVGYDTSQNRHGDAVAAFVDHALDEAPTEDDRRAATLMLSNPFDLSFAADLLAQGTMPQATSLIDASFRLADGGTIEQPGYRTLTGQPFPLVRFGRHATMMRSKIAIGSSRTNFRLKHLAC
jgi:HEAT repeats